ncbi:MAG: DUF998 domain-containing protein [Promethearchaeota archaeon]
MAIYNIIGDKTLQWAPGGVYGLISVIIGICCNLIALLLFPGYNITINMISELGVGPGGLFFNLGFIISGLMAIPFYISLGRTLDGEGVNKNLLKSAKVSSIISCVTFSLIGIFPAIPENEIILIMHGIIALISLTCGAIYLILFSILMLKNKNFSKLQAYLPLTLHTCFIKNYKNIIYNFSIDPICFKTKNKNILLNTYT